VTFASATENPKLKSAYSFYGSAGLTLAGLMGQYSGIQYSAGRASKSRTARVLCMAFRENDEAGERDHSKSGRTNESRRARI